MADGFGHSKKIKYLLAIVTFSLVIITSEALISLSTKLYDASRVAKLNSSTSYLRNELEREINSSLQISKGLIVNVASNPDITPVEFNVIAKQLIARVPHAINISLARDNVITHLYPYVGNERALGFDYEKSPHQYSSILWAIEKNDSVVQGPILLEQGGVGLVGTTPIFTGPNRDNYWGVASIVIDFESFSDFMDTRSQELAINTALKGKGGLGSDGELFYGDSELFDNDSNAAILPIVLPVGKWLLAVKNIDSHKLLNGIFGAHMLGIIAALIISILVLLLLESYENNQYLALHDTLTGLADRRLFEEQISHSLALASRGKTILAILYIDIDKFKLVNDKFGQKAGDAVLKECAVRMTSLLRQTDIVARVDGNQFGVMLHDLEEVDTAAMISKKLCSNLQRKITLPNGHRLNIEVNIGTAIYPIDGLTIQSLTKWAERSLHRARKEDM